MIAWCNNNQGFVSAILALCSVLVAIIALFISIRTSRKQNKIQIDLQARQLKLDTFQLRYNCWERLEKIYNLLELIKQEIDNGYENKVKSIEIIYSSFIEYHLNLNEEMALVNSSQFIFNSIERQKLKDIKVLLTDYVEAVESIKFLIRNSKKYTENNYEYFYDKISNLGNEIIIKLKSLLIKLEENLNLSDIIPK